jgi:hypothetical protein
MPSKNILPKVKVKPQMAAQRGNLQCQNYDSELMIPSLWLRTENLALDYLIPFHHAFQVHNAASFHFNITSVA